MDSIEHYDEKRNLARVASGWKGGPFNQNPNLAPAMHFSNGYPAEIAEKLNATSLDHPTPIDPWTSRRSNSSM